MPWIYLVIAGLFEIAWATYMKRTQEWTKLTPSLITLALMGVSFYLLSLAMAKIPTGTAYAVWTGIGAAGTAILGMIVYKEPATALRLVCIGAIVAGVLGLKLASK